MSIQSEVKLYGAELTQGETIREVCPLCGGGTQSEKSLAITRDDEGGLVYICHRASCGSRGTTLYKGGAMLPKLSETIKKRKVFEGKTVPLSKYLLERVRTMWGIVDPEHWYWTKWAGGRLAMSIRSPTYMHRGWVLRDIMGRSSIKALTYLDPDQEGLSWYRDHTDQPTILCEDIPSAVRASKYVNAVALLGTGVGLTKAAEIEQYATRPIIVALDQDATSTAFNIALRYSALWGDVEILMLEKDIKDMNEDEVRDLLQ
jgi:hypothetical protein